MARDIEGEKGTKERILDAALDMFARRGYDGTNLRDLAASLGLSKSALYRHFASKEAMWDALVERVEAYYGERFGSAASLPVPTSLDELAALVLRQIEFTIADPTIVKVRKVLAQEQFRDERMARLASLHFMDGIVELYAQVFRAMMDAGCLAADDAESLALEFVSPAILLVHASDREPATTQACLGRIRAHVERFCAAQRAKGERWSQLNEIQARPSATEHGGEVVMFLGHYR